MISLHAHAHRRYPMLRWLRRALAAHSRALLVLLPPVALSRPRAPVQRRGWRAYDVRSRRQGK